MSDVRYADWKAAGETPKDAAESLSFPRKIVLARPRDDYKLEIQITRLALNGTFAAEQFRLEQPEGTELVQVGENDPGTQP